MNLIKSTSTFSFFTIISRLFGYLRDILIANFLGVGSITDVFFVALRFPSTFRRLFSEGAFNAAFVPSYSSELAKTKKKAINFANSVFTLFSILLFFLVFLAEIFMPFFVSMIAPGFDGDYQKMELAINLTRITFPFLFFVSLSSFFSAVLNSHNKFAVTSAAPIILNILLVGVLLFGKILGDQLVYYMSYAVTLSGILQFLFLYFFLKKHYLPKFKFKINSKIKIFFNKLLPSIFSSGVAQINILVGTIIATFQANAVSYLYYADRIYQINLAIAGIAIGTVILPQLSKHVQTKKKDKINLIQNKALELSLFLSVPAAVALIIASEEIISALFGYGSFNQIGVKNTALALFYFAMGLPAFSIAKLFLNFSFARHNTKMPFYTSLFCVILNIAISVSFFNLIGFIIIPIATTISAWAHTILLFFFLKKDDLFNFNRAFVDRFIRIMFSVSLMGVFFNYLINLFDSTLAYEESLKFFYLIIIVLLGLIFYLIIAIFIKAFKISDIKLKY